MALAGGNASDRMAFDNRGERRLGLIAARPDLPLRNLTDLIPLEGIDSLETIILAIDKDVITVKGDDPC
jgi:hypothetical protein